MERSKFLLVVLQYMFLYLNYYVRGNSHFIFLTNYCSKTFYVHHSLVVALAPVSGLPADRREDFISCFLDITTNEGMGLMVHFTELSISPDREHSDHFHIFSMIPHKRKVSPRQGIYGQLNDTSSSEIVDYKIANSSMRIEYFGVPTVTHSGFKLLVSAYYDVNSKGRCPDRHLRCPTTNICLDGHLACDGDRNCGKHDPEDEVGCDRDNTITDLLANYSLTRDICLVILLPLIVFIICVCVIFCLAQRYIRYRLAKQSTPSIIYSRQHDGRVRIKPTRGSGGHLPAYSDVMEDSRQQQHPPESRPRQRHDFHSSIDDDEPPPSYSSLSDRHKTQYGEPNHQMYVHSVHTTVLSLPIQESSAEHGACGGEEILLDSMPDASNEMSPDAEVDEGMTYRHREGSGSTNMQVQGDDVTDSSCVVSKDDCV